MNKLLTRSQFREQVLARNKNICCVSTCAEKAVDAHHILNRNLFHEENEFGGYFFNNGAQTCNLHHLQMEQTIISTVEIYKWCNVEEKALPNHFLANKVYDTWGNIIVSVHQRKPGELFSDEGCQKALRSANLLWLFW